MNTAKDSIRITCADPNTVYTITAMQAQSGIFSADTTTATLVINRAVPKVLVAQNGFLLGTSGPIKYLTNTDAASILFKQVSGQNFIADVNTGGTVSNTNAAGSFSVRISLPGTTNYLPFTKVFDFEVVKEQTRPLALPDSVTLVVGQDTVINILENDQGVTAPLNYKKTDIDQENQGIQLKYYSTSEGNFVIDTLGNLSVLPFAGFIGTATVPYTVTDTDGLTSLVSYVYVMVKEPVEIPPLKPNEIMSPNNDGLNDALVIAYADLSKQNSLVILDEAGNVIFESDNYQNNWEGTDTKGRKIEPGVYYYIYTETVSKRQLTGYIQLK